MNFKKYHVSRNLFDKSSDIVGYYIASNSGVWTQTGSTSRSVLIKCESNTTYTISVPTNRTLRAVYFNNFPSAGDAGYGLTDNTTENYVNKTLTIMTGSSAQYLAFFCYNSSQEATLYDENTYFSQIMLNTGSTPLPYEPYSSEVWHDIPHYIHKTDTDTITTLPADIFPNAATATVGLKGNMQQTGTPTPTNPIQPSECGDMTGNLFDLALLSNDKQLAPSTGRPTDYTGRLATQNPIDVSNIDSLILTYSLGSSITEYFMYSTFSGGVLIERVAGKVSGDTIDVSNADELYIGLYIGGGNITVNNVQWVMLNAGSTALPYEPYGIKIPISSASTTTPVYLGEVESTRRIKKLVLTGEESYSFDSERSQIVYRVVDGQRCVPYCSHYIGTMVNTWSELGNGYITFHPTNNDIIRICDTAITSAANFKAYLQQQYAAGTPVTVWYVLATPETAVVNEPIRKIGDYADEVSGISIPVTAGGDTLSVDTTVQPSELTATYKGWHPAIVHERTNGAWT